MQQDFCSATRLLQCNKTVAVQQDCIRAGPAPRARVRLGSYCSLQLVSRANINISSRRTSRASRHCTAATARPDIRAGIQPCNPAGSGTGCSTAAPFEYVHFIPSTSRYRDSVRSTFYPTVTTRIRTQTRMKILRRAAWSAT